jgi:quercetin dioxygenase-like cupin family protein
MYSVILGVATLLLVTATTPAFAQQVPGGAAAAEGITNTRILDRADIRITRLEIMPKSTRSLHSHPDMQYQVFIPLTGAIDMNVEGHPSERVEPLNAHYLTGGVVHGFTNNSASPVTALEIFILKPAKAAGLKPAEAIAAALALASFPSQ